MRESHAGEIIAWIQERKRQESQEKNDIREGIAQIDDEDILFARRTIKGFSMIVPKDYVLLTETEKQQRYTQEAMPDIAFGEETGELFLTLTKLENIDCAVEKKKWVTEIQQECPKAKFYDEDIAETEEGSQIPYVFVALEGIGSKSLLGLFFLSVGAEVWQGIMQCPMEQRRDWRNVWKQMLCSVLEEETP